MAASTTPKTSSAPGITLSFRRIGVNYADPQIATASIKTGKTVMQPEVVTLTLANVPMEIAHSIQRVATSELENYMLQPDLTTLKSTEDHMTESFVESRIQQIPLLPTLSPAVVSSLRFCLNVRNPDFGSVLLVTTKDLELIHGDLPEPIFNMSFPICSLQPAKMMQIGNIGLVRGTARDFIGYQQVCRGTQHPLDIKKTDWATLSKYSDESLVRGDADSSGYQTPSMTANAQHHEVSFVVKSVRVSSPLGETGSLVTHQIIDNIVARMTLIRQIVDGPEQNEGENILIISTDKETKIIVMLRHETATLGNLTKRFVYDASPKVKSVGMTCTPHEDMLKITLVFALAHSEACRAAAVGIDACLAVFQTLKSQI
jgi:hypothetical protein